MTSRAGFAWHNEYNWLHQDGTGPQPGENINTSEVLLGFYEMNILNIKAFGGLLFLLLVMATLLFFPAWKFDYWQAWTFLAVYFASSLAITLYLMKKDPKLLERRMSGGPTAEKEPTQRIIMFFASLVYRPPCFLRTRSSLRVVSHAAVRGPGRRRACSARLPRRFFRVQRKSVYLRHH